MFSWPLKNIDFRSCLFVVGLSLAYLCWTRRDCKIGPTLMYKVMDLLSRKVESISQIALPNQKGMDFFRKGDFGYRRFRRAPKETTKECFLEKNSILNLLASLILMVLNLLQGKTSWNLLASSPNKHTSAEKQCFKMLRAQSNSAWIIIIMQASLWIVTKAVHFCFRFAPSGKVCIEMPIVLQWFLQLTSFVRLQHSTVSQLSSSDFIDLAFLSISIVSQLEGQNSAFVMCTQLWRYWTPWPRKRSWQENGIKYLSIFGLTLPVLRHLLPTLSTKGGGWGWADGWANSTMISKTVDSTNFNFGRPLRPSMWGKKLV